MSVYNKHAIGLIIGTLVLGVVAMFVPPVWVVCKCTYNEIKSFLIFPGSFYAGLLVIFLTYLRVKKGGSFRKTFLTNLALFIIVFAMLGFLVHPAAEFIEENDIPIFQPDYSDGLL
ncbi:hypothetical protein KC851_03645 [Candidatus Kaiserbacteria bacterium]|nr:hypothetical protein [Candidatus Kaiserbacteria bacterium]